MKRKVIPYNPKLVPLAKKLRQDMILSEVLLWQELRGKQLGFQFNRQIPVDEYIIDFYCKDLRLAIEIDGITHTYEGQLDKDQERLESLDVSFLRFDDLDVKTNVKWVVNENF